MKSLPPGRNLHGQGLQEGLPGYGLGTYYRERKKEHVGNKTLQEFKLGRSTAREMVQGPPLSPLRGPAREKNLRRQGGERDPRAFSRKTAPNDRRRKTRRRTGAHGWGRPNSRPQARPATKGTTARKRRETKKALMTGERKRPVNSMPRGTTPKGGPWFTIIFGRKNRTRGGQT